MTQSLSKPFDGKVVETVIARDAALLQSILVQGADPDEREKESEAPSILLATCLKARQIVEVLIEHDADVNAKDYHGFTSLMYAARSTDTAILSMLIENGAALDDKDPDGKTALQRAEEENVPDAVKIIKDAYTQRAHQAKLSASHAAAVTAQGRIGIRNTHVRRRSACQM